MAGGVVNRRAAVPCRMISGPSPLRVRCPGTAAMEPRMAGHGSNRFPGWARPHGSGVDAGKTAPVSDGASRFFRSDCDRRVDKLSRLLHTTRRFWRLGSSMAEQLTLNQLVLGSSPSRGTTSSRTFLRFGFGCVDPGVSPIRTPSSSAVPAAEDSLAFRLRVDLSMASAVANSHPL